MKGATSDYTAFRHFRWKNMKKYPTRIILLLLYYNDCNIIIVFVAHVLHAGKLAQWILCKHDFFLANRKMKRCCIIIGPQSNFIEQLLKEEKNKAQNICTQNLMWNVIWVIRFDSNRASTSECLSAKATRQPCSMPCFFQKTFIKIRKRNYSFFPSRASFSLWLFIHFRSNYITLHEFFFSATKRKRNHFTMSRRTNFNSH